MLGTPEFSRTQFVRGILPNLKAGRRVPIRLKDTEKGFGNYGRLAGSDEHSPSFAVPGSESGHALQVRRRAEDSRFQAGQSLALQEIEARPVDGRQVQPDGSEEQKQTEGSCQGCRATVKAGTCLDSDRKRLLVWMWGPRALRRSN